MILENVALAAMVNGVGDAIGASGYIEFYETASYITQTAGLMGTGQLRCSATVFTPAVTNGTGTFDTSLMTGVVVSTGQANYFSFKQGSATNDTVVFTGSVGVTGADINFNTNVWQPADIVNIQSLTFTQPTGP